MHMDIDISFRKFNISKVSNAQDHTAQFTKHMEGRSNLRSRAHYMNLNNQINSKEIKSRNPLAKSDMVILK